MKLKYKLYVAAALLLMLLGSIIGRFLNIAALGVVALLVLFLAWPLIKSGLRIVSGVKKN